ncbi:MAG: PQQ-binding-like beta-propeller repeat protein [Sedimenticola sp.]
MQRLITLFLMAALTAMAQAGESVYPGNPARFQQALYVTTDGLSRFDPDSGRAVWRVLEGMHLYEPVVKGDVVFVGSTAGLHAVDGASGKIRWHHAYAGPVFSPVLNGEVLYLAGQDGVLRSLLAASGELLWQAKPGAGWVYPPVVEEGLVVTGGQDGVVWAMDAASGEIVWQRRLDNELVYRPLLTDRGSLVVTSFGGDVVALDLLTGDERWRNRYPTPISVTSMTSSGVALGSLDGSLRLLDTSTGGLIWEHTLGDRLVMPAVEHRGKLMAVIGDGRYRILATDSGSILQHGRLGGEPLVGTFVSDSEALFFYRNRNNPVAASVFLNVN